ncbi:MAG: murein hydrolase activator EnvC [Gaiellaceae bacterium]
MKPLFFAVVLALVAAPCAAAWSWPAQGPVLRSYANVDNPYAAGQHRGIDIGAAAGEPVRAPAAGEVAFAASVPTHGRTVTIRTPDGWAVTLLHLGAIVVARGASVREGEVVGSIGPSGDAELPQPYVHLGIRHPQQPNGYVDPLSLLPALKPAATVAAAAPAVTAPAMAPPSPTVPAAAASPPAPTAPPVAEPPAAAPPGAAPPAAADGAPAGKVDSPAAEQHAPVTAVLAQPLARARVRDASPRSRREVITDLPRAAEPNAAARVPRSAVRPDERMAEQPVQASGRSVHAGPDTPSASEQPPLVTGDDGRAAEAGGLRVSVPVADAVPAPGAAAGATSETNSRHGHFLPAGLLLAIAAALTAAVVAGARRRGSPLPAQAAPAPVRPLPPCPLPPCPLGRGHAGLRTRCGATPSRPPAPCGPRAPARPARAGPRRVRQRAAT